MHQTTGTAERLKLLPKSALLCTGPVDHADWNYRAVLGTIQRVRFGLALALLPPGRVPVLLELGYGSGVFLPSLAARCDELLGLDVHPRASEVQEVLASFGVTAQLLTASAQDIPLPRESVDCVVAVSALEFVDDLTTVCREVSRILRRDGSFVVVTPRSTGVADCGLRLLTGKRAAVDFGRRRERVRPTLLREFRLVERRAFPPVASELLGLYDALRLTPR